MSKRAGRRFGIFRESVTRRNCQTVLRDEHGPFLFHRKKHAEVICAHLNENRAHGPDKLVVCTLRGPNIEKTSSNPTSGVSSSSMAVGPSAFRLRRRSQRKLAHP